MGSSHPGVDIAMTHTPSRMRPLPSSDPRAGHDALRIAIIAPPVVPLPHTTYAGTERIVASLATGLHEAGHRVTVFSSGDSDLPCEVVPVIPHVLRKAGSKGLTAIYLEMALA